MSVAAEPGATSRGHQRGDDGPDRERTAERSPAPAGLAEVVREQHRTYPPVWCASPAWCAILAHSAKVVAGHLGEQRCRAGRSRDGRMAGVMAPDDQQPDDAWERRRIQMSLRIERAGLELLERAWPRATSRSTRSPRRPGSRPVRSSGTSGTRATSSPRCRSASRAACAGRCSRGRPTRACSTASTRGSARWPTARIRRHAIEPLEVETLTLLERDRAGRARLVQSESRAMSALTAELESVVRARLGFGADDDREGGRPLGRVRRGDLVRVHALARGGLHRRPLGPARRRVRSPRAPAFHDPGADDRLSRSAAGVAELGAPCQASPG